MPSSNGSPGVGGCWWTRRCGWSTGCRRISTPFVRDSPRSPAPSTTSLHFLTCRDALPKLARVQTRSLAKIRGIGKTYTERIRTWQPRAQFAPEVAYVGPMIVADARRILELIEQIEALEAACAPIAEGSELAGRIDSIPGFGPITSAELAGEIGTLERFPSEASLALYVGMACLSHQSGQRSYARASRQVNRRAKAALMIALARHIEQVPESKAYYDRKRTEGKQHNQALRALGRHLIRVVWAMIHHQRNYEIRTPTALPQTGLVHDSKHVLAA
ncbi:MAG TPA: hypothetical protein DC005_02790 [Proteobacteria bacterium]|nr:hypothetical protein [Pseudomonadota bacterium]